MRRALVCMCALALACETPAPEAPRAVVDLETGAPIAGALVRAEGTERSARTDAEGRFTLAATAVHVSADGYLASTRRSDGTIALWPEAPSEAFVRAHLERLERARHRDDPDEPGLRPEARAYLRGELPRIEGDVGVVRASLDAPPATIRIWRRGLDGSTDSCAGRVDVLDLEEYVKGVLPHEWIPSWHDESLRAGALAIRTYAWNWVGRGGKYTCADLDDTTASQVYRDDRVERVSLAVDDTRGQAITSGGALVSGEYSAENGDPTQYGVAEPLCTGETVFGHGRGMCQWGSQRWASMDARDHVWIAEHYYPGAIVEGGGPALPDYEASFVSESAPASMVSGERAEAFVDLTNDGARTWDLGATRLGTSSPEDHASPFYDVENWIDETRATAPDESSYGTGDVGRFTFMITAPEVTEETVITDTLRLVQEGVGFFGPEVTISVRVVPRGGVVDPSPADDAGVDGGGLTGGCSAGGGTNAAPWLALIALACAIRRRPTRR